MSNTIILKKRGGLAKIANIQGGFREYKQKRIDRESEGVYIGEYREPSLPKSKHFLAPIWNELKDQWAWLPDSEHEIGPIVKAMKLRHESGNKKGAEIKPDEVDIKNFNDPFFTHSRWYANKFLDGGRIMLNLDVIEDKFFYFNYAGSHDVHDKTKETNSTFEAGASYEMINPRTIQAKAARDAKKDISATRLLSDLDFEKMKLIAEIMDVKTEMDNPDSLFVDLKSQAAENTEKITRYGKDKTAQDRFIELCKDPNEELSLMAQVIRAKKLRILVNRGNYYQFNTGSGMENSLLSDRLDGIQSDNQLINFFRNVDNQEYYIELSKQLEKKTKT